MISAFQVSAVVAAVRVRAVALIIPPMRGVNSLQSVVPTVDLMRKRILSERSMVKLKGGLIPFPFLLVSTVLDYYQNQVGVVFARPFLSRRA